MTLAEIELDIFRRLDYADVPPPSVKARIDGFINQRYRQILSHDRMRALRFKSIDFVQPAGESSKLLALGTAPIYAERVTRVLDLDNDFELEAHTFEWYREHFPDDTAITGTPGHWIHHGTDLILFAPTPNADVNYRMDYEHRLLPLVEPTDVPLLPLDFHDILAMYARADEYEFKSDDRFATTMAQVQSRWQELRAFVDNHDAYKRTALGNELPRHSRLGPARYPET